MMNRAYPLAVCMQSYGRVRETIFNLCVSVRVFSSACGN
jgi:hypothetical protein